MHTVSIYRNSGSRRTFFLLCLLQIGVAILSAKRLSVPVALSVARRLKATVCKTRPHAQPQEKINTFLGSVTLEFPMHVLVWLSHLFSITFKHRKFALTLSCAISARTDKLWSCGSINDAPRSTLIIKSQLYTCQKYYHEPDNSSRIRPIRVRLGITSK